MRPKDGYDYLGCPNCGYVVQLPIDIGDGEDPPWCVHANNYSWRDPHPSTQASPRAWTRMVLVDVQERDLG